MGSEDKNFISNIYDKITLSRKSGKVVFSNEFYTPDVWKKLQELSTKLGINVSSYGVFEESERHMVCFFSNQELNRYDYPIKLVKIINKSKFTKLAHKDFLGALMSLGINREKLGDLITEENTCFCAMCEDIYDYVSNRLTSIGKCPCTLVDIVDREEIPKPKLVDQVIIATSYRVDCIVSALSGISRNKCLSLINSGKVLVDYEVVTEKDRLVNMNSVITLRGYGKYKILGTNGNSGSGRLRINMKKYV